MLTNDSMVCNKCGRVFPLFNNELVLRPNVGSMGWHHLCRECLQKEDKMVYSTTTDNLDKHLKEIIIYGGK